MSPDTATYRAAARYFTPPEDSAPEYRESEIERIVRAAHPGYDVEIAEPTYDGEIWTWSGYLFDEEGDCAAEWSCEDHAPESVDVVWS